MLRWTRWVCLFAVLSACSSNGSTLVGAVDAGGIDAPCAADETRCGGACTNPQTDRNHCGACGTRCQNHEACVAGRCATACLPGGRPSARAAASTCTDRAHRGACGAACGTGPVCAAGQCALECGANLATCGGDGGAGPRFCAITCSDNANCGACGTLTAGQLCQAGACVTAPHRPAALQRRLPRCPV
ncbi:MAG: hypothetical protein U0325_05540 [Polyangiales bacterium]